MSPSILRDGVCMSTGLKRNTSRLVYNTPCPILYNGVLVIVGAIYLCGQLFWV
jgi:hypothetical protein